MASNRVPPVGGTTASTSSAGIVQLTDSTSSTSTTTAATPNSVKSAYDLANGAIAKTLTTTTGDIIYASSANTPARLGIGSTGQVLTVSGGVPSWANPASGMTYITGSTFSSVSSFSLPTNTFTTTYDIYKIYLHFTDSSSATKLRCRMRNSGTDVTSGNYFNGGGTFDYFSSTTYYTTGSADTSWQVRIGEDSNNLYNRTILEITVTNPRNSTYNGRAYAQGLFDRMGFGGVGWWQNAVSTFDSLSFIKETSGTFSGKYDVYALTKS